MRLWIEPITDRTISDVNYVKELKTKGWDNMSNAEKVEWMSGLKGSINRSDYDRIKNNILLLSDIFELKINMDDAPTFPDKAYYEKLLEYIEIIRKAYCVRPTTPVTPKMPLNRFDKWNAVEKILDDVYFILTSNFFYYAGAGLYSGGDIGLLE